ncbi:MAG TPA: hypothetical protein VGF59_11765 [Bryobacteraceae bacterium]|jgi:hypothetical protein
MVTSELLEQSLADLENQMERHRKILHAVVGGRPEIAAGDCPLADCRHHRKLCRVLLEAIAAMEETRKAFKSRRLEELRKEFARILHEEMGDAHAG